MNAAQKTALTIETQRLILRPFELADCDFLIRLLNSEGFIGNIGDRGVRTIADAERYLQGPFASYQQHGFGLSAMVLKTDQTLVGMAGLIKRDSLPEVDLGYALLPEHTLRGYALEAAEAWVASASNDFGLQRLLAVVIKQNKRSIQLLEKLGFVHQAEFVDAAEPDLLRYLRQCQSPSKTQPK